MKIPSFWEMLKPFPWKSLFIAFPFFFLFGTPILAQNSTLRGRVTDSDGVPLPNANVRLIDQDSILIASESSDAEGIFMLKSRRSGTFTFIVSFVGLETYQDKVILPAKRDLGDIKLRFASEDLGEVVVRGNPSRMNIKSDTVVFNAAMYAPPAGSVLEDLIKRLPGASVDRNGAITINGKTIDKITLEGKEFFAGDPAIATQSLPAEAIEKLEMHEREDDESRLTGFSNGEDETVLNITFKPQYKGNFFGSLNGGYGTANRFDSNALLNHISGKNRQTLLFQANNTNNRGVREMGESGARRSPRHPREGNGVTSTISVGLDMTQDLGLGDLEGNGSYRHTKNNTHFNSRSEQNVTQGKIIALNDTQRKSRGHEANMEAKIEIKPIEQLTLMIRPFLSWNNSLSEGVSASESELENGSKLNSVNSTTAYENKYLGIGSQLNAAYRLNDRGRMLTLHAFVRGNKNFDESKSDAQSLIFSDQNKRSNHQFYNIIDDNRLLSSIISTSWIEPLTETLFLRTQLHWSHIARNTGHNIQELAPKDPNRLLLNEDMSGLLKNRVNTYSAELALQQKTSTYDITLGIKFAPTFMRTYFKTLDKEGLGKYFTAITPSFRLDWRPSKKTSLRIDYWSHTSMPTVGQMIPFADPSNPMLVTIGNLDLKPSYRHRVRSFFRHYNSNTRVASNIFFRGVYTVNDVVQDVTTDIKTGKQTVNYRNASGTIDMNLFGNLVFPIFNPNWTIDASFGAMYRQNIGYIEGKENKAYSIIPGLRPSIIYASGPYYWALRSSIGTYITRYSLSSTRNQVTLNYEVGTEISYEAPFGLRTESDFFYRGNKGYGAGFEQNSCIWNLALSYTFLKSKNATVRLKVYDILNQENGLNRTNTALAIVDTRTNVLGRYALLSFIYRFGSRGSSASRNDRPPFGPPHGGPR